MHFIRLLFVFCFALFIAVSTGYAQEAPESLPPGSAPLPAPLPAPVPDQGLSDDWGLPPGTCSVELIAGTFESVAGDITCVPGGIGLECCYGTQECRQMLNLRLTPNLQHLSGEWEHYGRAKGPVKFALTEKCDITHGVWGFSKDKMQNRWVVGERK